MYLGHLAFMVYACISPGTAGEQWSLAGMMVLRSALNKDKILGAFYAVAFCLFIRRGGIVVSMRWCGTSLDLEAQREHGRCANGRSGRQWCRRRSALRSVV